MQDFDGGVRMGIKTWRVRVKSMYGTDDINLPWIRHTGLNIFIFAGSVALKLSRATCFACLLVLFLYESCICSRNVSRNVSLIPVDVL